MLIITQFIKKHNCLSLKCPELLIFRLKCDNSFLFVYIKSDSLFGATIVFGCSFHKSFESVGLQSLFVRRQAKHHIAHTRITAVIPYPRNPGKFLKPIFKTCCMAKMFLSSFFFSLQTLFFKTTCKHTNSPFIN